jgi:hypothetical protein
MTAVQAATKALDDAMNHRSIIGAELCPTSPPDVVASYEAALEVEAEARLALKAAIDRQRDEQMRNAGIR